MIWILYDTNPERAVEVSAFLMGRYGIEALPYHEIEKFLQNSHVPATFLIHCEALNQDFHRLAGIKLSGKHALRFYCTDRRDRNQQVIYITEEAEKLVS